MPAGWRSRATAAPRSQAVDQGYGLVCDAARHRPFGDLIVQGRQPGARHPRRRATAGPIDLARYPGRPRLRILPNHACATAAQFAAYHVLGPNREVAAVWPRFNGW